jgi:hypothetical protein
MRIRSLNQFHRQVSGQAMTEFIIIFPALFMLILLIIQTSLILTARQIVNYAAFNGARSVIVHMASPDYHEIALRAAAISCIPISPRFTIGSIPIVGNMLPAGLDILPGDLDKYITQYVLSRYLLTTVDIFDQRDNSLVYDGAGNIRYPLGPLNPGENVTVTVTHNYIMRIPIINKLFFKMYWLPKVKEELGFEDLDFLDQTGVDLSDYADTAADYVLNKINLPGYWIPISASSTLTIENSLPAIGYNE